MYCDTHTHLKNYSNDAVQTLDQLLEQARSKGLSAVCTTDHYEKDVYYTGGREDVFNLQTYFDKQVAAAGRLNGSFPRLLTGIELGYLPHLKTHLSDVAGQWPFDQVIASLHILEGEDPYINQDMYVNSKQSIYGRYLDQLTVMIEHCPDFDILGHYDYISRYAPYPDIKMRYCETPEAFDRLFKCMISQNKTLEINTRSIVKLQTAGYTGQDAWPDREIIKQYIKMGGKMISLGSDAHKPDEAGLLFNETVQWLMEIGVSEVVHYEKRQPVLTKLT